MLGHLMHHPDIGLFEEAKLETTRGKTGKTCLVADPSQRLLEPQPVDQ